MSVKVTTVVKGTMLVLRNCNKKESTEFSKLKTKDIAYPPCLPTAETHCRLLASKVSLGW